MAPRAPAHDHPASVADDDSADGSNGAAAPAAVGGANGSATSSNDKSKGSSVPATVQKHPSKWWPFRNTFHWELNVYSFALLGLLYAYATPVEHRWFWHYAVLPLVAVDAARYYLAKSHMVGVPYTLPFVSLIAMIVHPSRFWAELADLAMAHDGVCSNTLVGNYMVFVTDPAMCREIMTGEGTYGMYAHPNAMWLFGAKNLIYLPQERHKKFRAILTPALFSQEALRQFAGIQEEVVRRFLKEYSDQCTASGRPFDAQVGFRSMAAVSSQESFMGPYLTAEFSQKLEHDILAFTMGFLCFPFPHLNSGLAQAVAAKHRIEQVVREIVPKARAYVQGTGNAPRCMMEHWSVSILEAAREQGVDPQAVAECHDDDMARTVLDFLFAAQDATNSALTYSLDVLDAHPDVLDKMRAEVAAVCGDDTSQIWDKKDQLEYVAKVANQMLHHKPPVPMVPHITKKPCVLAGKYSLPKGSVVIPSITYSGRVSGASNEFLPDRDDDDRQFVRCVTFGAGQHKCPGRRYAESLLTIFLAVLAAEYDICRVEGTRRPTADEFFYFPTVFPDDSEFVLTPRGDSI